MAEPELPPWLTQQADPIGSIYKGVQTGGAIAGVLNQRNLNQSRLRLEQQEQQINHLRMEKAIKDRDDTLEADFIMQAVPEQIAPLLAAGKPADARNVLLSLGARKPAVFKSDSFPKLLESVEAAVRTEDTRLRLESMDRRAFDAETGRNNRANELNTLRLKLAEVRNTRGFAPPEIARLVKFRDDAIISGDTDTAEIYDREITIHQAKATTTAKSRIHTEFATTLRQEMRAIDANTKLSKAQKDEAKAPLMRQLEASRRAVLSELEPELPDEQAPLNKARTDAVANIDKQIADLEVDLARNPKRARWDLLGEENRREKIDELKAQRQRLQEQQPATAPANTTPPEGPPQAPVNPTERQAGQIYRLPLGDYKWTGTGWIKP